MQSTLDLLPVFCAIALYAARIREFFVKRNVVTGQVNERATFLALLISGTLVVTLALVEYLVRDTGFHTVNFIAGLIVAGLSFVVRAAAVRALGRMWSVHIEIRREHELVRSGPFRWVRHPIYLAAILELVGAMLFMNSVYTWIVFVFFFVPSLVARIRLEERAMIVQFGDDYLRFRKTTPAVLPWRGPTC
ncbi:MAG: isoprenylcysteine carboxylmethyltransferase family protein [Rariglobus sp.]|nr:isoprenylcysteine carboxylmethyltransferase family protein [Rariglobus sp.]